MRRISKTMLRTCAGLAVAAGLVVGGTGAANAATATPTTQSNHHPGPACNPFAREQWNLNGSNHVEAVYLGSTFTYSVTFRQFGSCLTGTLTDPYFPTTGPIFGTVFGNHVIFSFRYPSGSIQGTRTYIGTIHRLGRFGRFGRSGAVSGTWSETGSENGSGTFTLAKNARSACPSFFWWNPNRACLVFP
jgi:hypothetical protein